MSDCATTAQRLWDLVYAYDAAYDRAARQLDLSAAQACLLNAVAQTPHTMGELASELLCDASNVTQMTSRLEARGLVERTVLTRDRRSKRVTITGRGLETDQRMREAFGFPRTRIGRLSTDDQRTLTRLLSELLEHPDETEDDR